MLFFNNEDDDDDINPDTGRPWGQEYDPYEDKTRERIEDEREKERDRGGWYNRATGEYEYD
ncbi:MAG: hypothetical protein ACP5D7_20085 [Limnospira sp.]